MTSVGRRPQRESSAATSIRLGNARQAAHSAIPVLRAGAMRARMHISQEARVAADGNTRKTAPTIVGGGFAMAYIG